LDEKIEVKVNVSATELPEYKAHPDDLELDNEPTLFEQVRVAPSFSSISNTALCQMMSQNLDDSDSDDEHARARNNGTEEEAVAALVRKTDDETAQIETTNNTDEVRDEQEQDDEEDEGEEDAEATETKSSCKPLYIPFLSVISVLSCSHAELALSFCSKSSGRT
jgi:hypothetical protein